MVCKLIKLATWNCNLVIEIGKLIHMEFAISDTKLETLKKIKIKI